MAKKILRTSKQKLIRTLRVRNENVIGTLASLISACAEAGADLGNVSTVSLGEVYNTRDITLIVDDHDHLQELIRVAESVPHVTVLQVIDEVLELHHGGKIKVVPTYPVKEVDDLQKVYTPGVAEVCKLIREDQFQANNYTSIQRSVALVTNGSRVLGLGNLGPVAAMPVMEGKAALFSQFTGLNMVPILLQTRDPKKFIETVVEISHGFGAIQMEDIESPENFEIESELIKRLDKPVMHDDQHGTAVVALGAALRACELSKVKIEDLKIGQLGLGAAGQAIALLISSYTGKTVLGSDINDEAAEHYCSRGGQVTNMKTLFETCDLIVMTTGRAGLVKPRMVRKGQILLALSNPAPEITIDEARSAGAAFVLDGTRVNNALGFPGIFKGALSVMASKITPEMYIAAAQAIAKSAPTHEVVPSVFTKGLHTNVARAVADAAIKSGVAQRESKFQLGDPL